MAISQELASIKSAGTYRREFDLSTMQPTYESTYSRGRIVPGFSYKGPFNKPFKIVDSDQFVSIFGGIDPKLEANGCFFHRTAIDMLKAGPIIALNLHSYAEADKIISGYAIGTKKAHPFKSLIKGVFSTALWYEPWPDRLRDSWEDTNIIGQEEGALLCDFEDKGQTSPVVWPELSDQELYDTVTYHNVLIFSEDINRNCKHMYYIKDEQPIGRVCMLRYKKADVDTYGSNAEYVLDEETPSLDVLLYNKEVYEKDGINYQTDSQEIPGLVSVNIDNASETIDFVYEPTSGYDETLLVQISLPELLKDNLIGNRILIDTNDEDLKLNVDDPAFTGDEFVFIANASGNDIRAYVYKTPSDTSSMLAYNIPISDYYGGDIPFELQEYLDEQGYDAADYTLADFMFTLVIFNDVRTLSNDMLALKKAWGLGDHGNTLQFIREDDALFDCNGMSGVITYTGASVPGLVNASGVDISIDTFLRNLAATTNIVGYTKPYCEKGTPAKKRILETVRMEKIPVGAEPSAQYPDNFKAILNTLRDTDGTPLKYAVAERDPKTGKFIPPTTELVWGRTNMWKAITDRMVVSFRYLVDCWGYGIEPSSKSIFSKVCLAQHATGLLNAPSALALSKVDEFTDVFGSIDYKALATSDTFTVPNIKDGATHVGYFYPWNRRGAKLLPPAGVVSNLFIQKDNPWSVAAGVLRGVLNGYNPEVPLSTKDREWLEAMGINAIIDAGDDQHTICVYGNKTAKQKPVSALSALSFRDFVVYIMDEIENIIRPYVFIENTEAVRTEIVSKCTTFLKSVTATPNRSGGLTAFEVIMNETNNTAEIIDNFYGVLDIKIEGARPMEKIAQRLYILPTGALTANAE